MSVGFPRVIFSSGSGYNVSTLIIKPQPAGGVTSVSLLRQRVENNLLPE